MPGIVDPSSLSFEAILADLQAHMAGKPNGLAWQDWYESSDGRIVAEWIAGIATFRTYHQIMQARESQLDYAQLESSVFNLAFNKGLLIPPSTGAEMVLNLTTTSNKSVDIGQFIGTVGGYELYSLEAKTINNTTSNLRCVVGHLNTITRVVPGLKAFQTFDFLTTDKFFAAQLESLTVDDEEVPLLSDPDYLSAVTNDFILRRVQPSHARLYFGNGAIGYYKPSASSLTYTFLTYGLDITEALNQVPRILIDATLNTRTVDIAPSFDPDKEEVREIARYYPLDGRVVTDNDYAAVIKKNFGGVLLDIFSFNSDPDQEVHLLKDDSFTTSGQETIYQARIESLINTKRTLGMPVNYTYLAKAAGKTFTTQLTVPPELYTNDLATRANLYLADQLWKFQRTPRTLTTANLAVELSAKFGITFYPKVNVSHTLALLSTDFLKAYSVSINE